MAWGRGVSGAEFEISFPTIMHTQLSSSVHMHTQLSSSSVYMHTLTAPGAPEKLKKTSGWIKPGKLLRTLTRRMA